MIKKILILLLILIPVLSSGQDALQILNKHWNVMRKEERNEKITTLKFSKKYSRYEPRKYFDYLKIWRKGDSLFRLDRLDQNAVDKFNEKVKETFYYNYGKVFYNDYKSKYIECGEDENRYELMKLLVFDDDNFDKTTLVNYDIEKYPLMFECIVEYKDKKYYKLFQITDSVDYVNNYYFDVETGLFYLLDARFEGNSMYKREIVSYTMVNGYYFPKIVRTYIRDVLFYEREYNDIIINIKIDDRFFHPEPE